MMNPLPPKETQNIHYDWEYRDGRKRQERKKKRIECKRTSKEFEKQFKQPLPEIEWANYKDNYWKVCLQSLNN